MNAEERVFPVTIDPAFTSKSSSVIDLNINSTNLTTLSNNDEELTVMDNSIARMMIHWKMKVLPSVPASARITEAYVQLCLRSGYGAYVGAYEVTHDWDATLTWEKYTNTANPQGTINKNLVDYLQLTNPGEYKWNVTELAQEWYRGNNFGVVFQKLPLNTTNATFYSNEIIENNSTSNPKSKPSLTVAYIDMKGLESYWPYSSHSVGTAGSGNVNLANGNLVFTIPTIGATDNIFSYTPYLTYDSSLAGKNYIYGDTYAAISNAFLGTGIKLSVNETIISETNGDTYYIYSDPDGTEHYFMPDEDGNYSDEDGLGLTLTLDASQNIIITDAANQVRFFERVTNDVIGVRWRLSYVKDISGNKLIFTYKIANADVFEPLKISLLPKDNDTAIDLLEFRYHNTTGKLIMVYNPTAQIATVFRYSSSYSSAIVSDGYQYLRQIDYAVGNASVTADNWYNFALNETNAQNITVYDSSKYNYDSQGRLIEAIDVKENTSVKYTWGNKYIEKISEYGGTSLGNEIRFMFRTDRTVVQGNGNDGYLDTLDDVKNTYVIDDYGRCISVYSSSRDGTTIYGANNYVYDDKENSKNSLKETSIFGNNATNYLINGSFEDVNEGYPAYWRTNGNVSSTDISGVKGSFEKSVTMRATENYRAEISQRLVLATETYTLSFPIYVTRGEGVTIRVTVQDINTNEIIHFEQLSPVPHSADSVLTTTFTVPGVQNYKNVTLTITLLAPSDSSSVHIVEIDSVMLCKGIGTARFDMIEYGSFEESLIDNSGIPITISAAYWVDEDGNAANSTASYAAEGQRVIVENTDGKTKYIKQMVYEASAEKLSECDQNGASAIDNQPHTLSVAGFADANVAVRGKPLGLKVEIVYYRGNGLSDITDVHYFDFLADNAEWQFIYGDFTLGYKQNGERIDEYLCIKSISVYCDCSNHYGARVTFNDISLIYVGLDAITIYTYTDDGKVESAIRGENGQFYAYNEYGNEKYIADNDGNLIEYVYDNACMNRVKEMIVYEFTFNGGKEFPIHLDTPFESVDKVAKRKTVYEYNSYGLVVDETTYAMDDGEIVAGTYGQTKLTYSYDVAEDSKIFGALLSEKDPIRETRYFYNSSNGWLLASVNVDSGYGYAYTYDIAGRLIKVDVAFYEAEDYTVADDQEQVTYEYDTNNRLSVIATRNTAYFFTYDQFGNSDSISVGDRTLAEYEYGLHNGNLERIIYGNGYEIEYVYNDLEQLEQIKYKADVFSDYTVAYEYKYMIDGQVCYVRDNVNERVTIYDYDTEGKLLGYKEFDSSDYDTVMDAELIYDDASRLSYIGNTFTYNMDGVSMTDSIEATYSYFGDGKMSAYTVSGDFVSNSEYSYDTLDRLSRVVYNNSTENGSVEISYDYGYGYYHMYAYGESSLVTSFSCSIGIDSNYYDYSYSFNGNIESIGINGNYTYYEYDELGQLISESNEHGFHYTYTYDDAGNLIEVSRRNNHSIDIENTYSYTDSEWGDLLTEFNGYEITYDAIGNPLSYYNGSEYFFTWQGRRLMTADMEGKQMSFTYNEDGLRLSKTVDGFTTYFVYDGSLLVCEYNEEETIVYIYDANGSPIGFKYRSTWHEEDVWEVYWYEKNLQGDIVSIYDEYGNLLVTYTYNAWGRKGEQYYNGADSTAAVKNNLRYRSYYYDPDLEMYYLQSRYYDYKICRFISPDELSYLGANGGLIGYNLYAYCNNDPITYTDYTGNFAILAFLSGIGMGILVGAIAGTIATILKDYNDDGEVFNGSVEEAEYFGNIIGGTIAGIGIGICSTLGAGLGAAMLAGESAVAVGSLTLSALSAISLSISSAFLTGTLGYAARTAINKKETFQISDMLIEGAFNTVSGVLSFCGGWCGGAAGVANPGAKLGIKNFLKFQISMAYFNVYTVKILLSTVKGKARDMT